MTFSKIHYIVFTAFFTVFFFTLSSCQSPRKFSKDKIFGEIPAYNNPIKNLKSSTNSAERSNDENNTVFMDTRKKNTLFSELKGPFQLPLRDIQLKNSKGTVYKTHQPLVHFENQFASGKGLPSFRIDGKTPVVSVVTYPENLIRKSFFDTGVINDSPWYAFKIKLLKTIKNPQKLLIEIAPGLGEPHRYHPWISVNSKGWNRAQNVEVLHFDARSGRSQWKKTSRSQVGFKARFYLNAQPGEEYTISAQPLDTPEDSRSWLRHLSKKFNNVDSFAIPLDLGDSDTNMRSKELPGILISENMELKRPNLVVVGGQHPPEVMGRRGLQFFIEEILAANALSKNFRDKFNVIAIPMINETGIALGHWRHNTRGVDSNRDWAPGDLGFQSPETRALRNLLNSFDSEKNPHVAFFDFHSTYKITAYAPDSQGSDRSFLECFEKSVQSSNPKFKQWAPRWFSPEKYNSIGFMWSQRQYKIPSIAIEFDDNMDLSDARKFAQSLANSSMALLLNPGSCSTKK